MTELAPQGKSESNHSLGPLRGDAEALPRNFGRLILLRRLARGGMGEVYLAATGGIEGAERPVVVKTIRSEHLSDKSFRARFLDETRIMAQLQHPGVAQILEAATTSGEVPYAVMEYIEGRHLGEVLARSTQLGVRVAWADAVAIGIGFADALHHVHTRTDASGYPLEIAHRDLSPQNVMLGYSGDLKLIDFGTARGENRRCRTVSGVVYAKPGYVAPEVAQQIPGGRAADLYAFGIMLWELAAGRRFLQGDPVEHQAQVAAGTLNLPELGPRVGAPAELDALLSRLTETDPDRRPSDAGQVARELVEILRRSPPLANGDRSVRGRVAQLMAQLYPAEPARSRADFARRLAEARQVTEAVSASTIKAGVPEPSPGPAPVQDEMEGLLPGTRYRLVRPIATGAMSEVWEAIHVDLGRTVALKILPESARADSRARAQFRAEARALSRLDHPGLVKVHDFGFTSDGRSYFGLELLEGETLEKKLSAGPLAPEEAVRIIVECLDALKVAHAAGVVHRDITPSNLFLTKEHGIKLIDFGVSFAQGQAGGSESGEEPKVVGTPEYISPEQAAGMEAEPESDLYSVGAVLYECLTGRVPHPLGPGGSPTLAALLTAKISLLPPPPSTIEPGLARFKGLDRVVLTALRRDPKERFASTEAFRLALESTQKSTPKSRPKLAFQPRLALGLTLSAAGGALAIAFLLGRVAPTGEPSLASSAKARPDEITTVSLAPQVIDLDANEGTRAAPEGSPIWASSDGQSDQLDLPLESEVGKGAESEVPDKQLDLVRMLLKKGKLTTAHHEMREIARHREGEEAVLALLTQTARGVRAWGEALDAASERVRLHPTAAAYIELAKLEHATLKGDPMLSLRRSLEFDPENFRAKELLSSYERERKLAGR
jgi:eukaryotic-like serine/threonine-protein kinase